MRAIPVLIVIALAGLQGLIAFYWMRTSARESFSNVFEAFHGKTPVWSQVAFSFGELWLVVPVASIAIVGFALYKKVDTKFLWKICTVSLLITMLMVYAMYPVHSMLKGLP